MSSSPRSFTGAIAATAALLRLEVRRRRSDVNLGDTGTAWALSMVDPDLVECIELTASREPLPRVRRPEGPAS